MSVAESYQLALMPFTLADDLDVSREYGEVFTRRWVVDMILDLSGYTPDRDLTELTIVEPACGQGAFVEAIAARLGDSARRHGRTLPDAVGAVRAFDLLPANVATTRAVVEATLIKRGWAADESARVAQAWVRQEDYLLASLDAEAVDVVVGNPPYIRLEDVPSTRSVLYRRMWPTMTGRADVFIGFIERGLRSLKPGGKLGFICADRWMRNQYGKGLRELIASRFSVDVVVSMHDVDAFKDSVSAYPAVTILSARAQGAALVVDTTSAFGAESAADVVDLAAADDVAVVSPQHPYTAVRLPQWFSGPLSWPQGSPARLRMIEYLTDNFPPLQDSATGTKVGIGVATGADESFIVSKSVDVEEDRLLPLAMVRDLASGELKWSGHYLVSPWLADGLVSLDAYPRLAAYYTAHSEALLGRHVAGKNPKGWYRTIDRVDVTLTRQAKLLIPDIRMTLHPVLDEGETYPHHNLYHVTSLGWDLRVLGGLLLSEVANAFVEAYAVKMRGGTLRFQAQYLRRIRVPTLGSISTTDAHALAAAFESRDVRAATHAALRAYGLKDMPR